MKKIIVLLISLSFLLCGCGLKAAEQTVRPSAIPEKKVTKTAIPPAPKSAAALLSLPNDPWQRCSALGNTDITPEKITSIENEELQRRIRITFMVQKEEIEQAFIAERCMDGNLYVCQISPQTNCAERLNFSTEPNEAMKLFCSDPDLEGSIVSPVISQINSAYEWRCHDGSAVITAQIAESDEAGYDKSIWFEIPQPE